MGGQGGKVHNWSEESRQKLSTSLSSRIITWGAKISLANTGNPLTQSTKDKMSQARSNRGETSRLNRYATCPHCNVTTNLGNIARYHNDKCKSVTLVNES